MTLLATHPGKFGDVAWSLAAIRAMAEQDGPFDFATTTYCEKLLPLLRRQPYLRECFTVPDWHITGSCPGMQPWQPPDSVSAGRRAVCHLGMREWPAPNLFHYYHLLARRQGWNIAPDPSPWITVADFPKGDYVAVAFNDLWAERKAELAGLIFRAFPDVQFRVLLDRGARFAHELASVWDAPNAAGIFCDVDEMASLIAASRFLIACKTLPFVLACGIGKPCVVVEADHARHQAIFDFPYPGNILVPWPLPDRIVLDCVGAMLSRDAQ